MLKHLGLAATCFVVSACGDTNFNEIFVSKAERETIDQLLIEAKYAYNKGRFDEVIKLSEKVTSTYPYHEKALVLKSNAYLAKADFDVLSIVEAIIDINSKAKTNLADSSGTNPTSSLLGKLAQAFPLSESDLQAITSGKREVQGVSLYIPKSSPEGRATEDVNTRIYNLSKAVSTLCPLLGKLYPAENQDYLDLPIYKKTGDGSLKDSRYLNCGLATEAPQMAARTKFSWALANIAEAVAFYSVVMYSSDSTNNTPNIQVASQSLKNTGSPSEFISNFSALTDAVGAIFPTENADSSMLNAIFDDLTVASVSLGSIAGLPSDVSAQILNATSSLKEEIKKITGAQDTANSTAAQQNEALRNTLTKASASQIDEKINTLPAENRTEACALFQKLNSDPNLKPAACQ